MSTPCTHWPANPPVVDIRQKATSAPVPLHRRHCVGKIRSKPMCERHLQPQIKMQPTERSSSNPRLVPNK